MKTKPALLPVLASAIAGGFIMFFVLKFFFPCSKITSENPISYDTVYSNNGYLILKHTHFDYSKFIGINPGRPIDDDTARQMIQRYYQTRGNDVQFVDFDFISLIDYFSKFRSTVHPRINDAMGVRAYLGLRYFDHDSLSILFSPTFNKQALWRDNSGEDIRVFDMGSACPNNCPDRDENIYSESGTLVRKP